jgi:hypothetical protein
MHYIGVKSLEKLILETIRRISAYAQTNEAEFIEKIRESTTLKMENSIKENQKSLTKYQRRHDELNSLIKKLYEGNASGKIPDKHFERMLAEYDTEQTELEGKITELQGEIDAYKEDSVRLDKFLGLLKRYTTFDELTAPMLNEFVEKIFVHQADKSSGERIQKVDIHLNFIGNFEVPVPKSTPEEIAEMERRKARRIKTNATQREYRRRLRAERHTVTVSE